MKNMLNFKNFSAEELQKILDLALDMKKNPEKYTHWRARSSIRCLRRQVPVHSFLSRQE